VASVVCSAAQATTAAARCERSQRGTVPGRRRGPERRRSSQAPPQASSQGATCASLREKSRGELRKPRHTRRGRRGPDPGPRVATSARAAAGSAPRRRRRAWARRPPSRQLLVTREEETVRRLPPPDRQPWPRQPPPRAAPRSCHVVCHRRRRSGEPQRRLLEACPCLAASCCAERESLPDNLAYLPLRPLTTPGDCPSQWLP